MNVQVCCQLELEKKSAILEHWDELLNKTLYTKLDFPCMDQKILEKVIS